MDILAGMSRGCYEENWSRGIPAETSGIGALGDVVPKTAANE